MNKAIILLMLIAVAFATGCSGNGNSPLTPTDAPTIPEANAEDASRLVLGVYGVDVDLDAMTITPIPLREPDAHYNVTGWLYPPYCDDCLEIVINGADPVTRIIDVSMTVRNQFHKTGYDLRCIVHTTDAGHLLTNADDWSLWWDKPGGNSINPFKAFAKTVPNRAFPPTAEDTQNFLIYIPDPPDWGDLTFVVDVSWPANCEEPYSIENFQQLGELYDYTGATVNLEVDVLDWQDNIDQVWVTVPLITGEIASMFTHKSGDTYECEITNAAGAPAGEYNAKLVANSGPTHQGAVDYFTITITEAGVPTYPVDITPDHLNFSPHGIDATYDNLFVAAGPNGFHIFDRSIPYDPQWEKRLDVGEWPVNVHVDGGYAYVADGFGGLNIVDIDPVASAYQVTTVGPTTNTYSVDTQGEYAYVAASGNGMYIIDVVPPETAFTTGIIDTPGIAVDIAVEGNYAYVAEYFIGSLQVVDVSDPYDPIITDSITSYGSVYTVETTADLAFLGTSTSLVILDISVQGTASVITEIPTPGSVSEIDVIPGGYLLITDTSGQVHLVDYDPVISASIIKSTDIGGSASCMAYLNGHLYIGDAHSGIRIFNVYPPYYLNPIAVKYTPCGAKEVAYDDGFAYVSNSTDGLQLIDVNTPAAAYVFNVVDTDYAEDSVVSGGLAYVADSDSGMKIVDIDPPGMASVINGVITGGDCRAIDYADGYAYMADDGNGLTIIDTDPPGGASVFNTVPLDYARGVCVDDGYAYVAGSSSGLYVIDIDPPETASVVHTVDTWSAKNVTVEGDYAYVAGSFGMQIVDISTPESASVVKDVGIVYWWNSSDIAVQNGYAFMASGAGDAGKLIIFDVDPVLDTHDIATLDFPSYAYGVAVDGNMCFVATSSGGLRIVELW